MELGLYIHVPFCVKRCHYCDFYTCGGHHEISEDYVQAVIRELMPFQNQVFTTVYFGGGTPSLLQPRQIQEILNAVTIQTNAEITLEANPETVSLQKLKGYRQAGINRLSYGVQTASAQGLQTLGRIHTTRQVQSAFQWAQQAGFDNISGDLMIGLGDYSEKEMVETVDLLEHCGATHISMYMLKIEEGTPFASNPPANLPNEDQMCDYYLAGCQALEQRGYIQYEISNFAKEGCQAKHNTLYWQLKDYIGIGPSAHSCFQGQRFYYPPSLEQFMKCPEIVQDGRVDVDDYIMLSLRLKTGLDLVELEEKWHKKLTLQQKNKIALFQKQGLVEIKGNSVVLTPQGFLMENQIACEIMC